jgi:mannose-1-phosphate guanylyltransferase/phosphomannomutase
MASLDAAAIRNRGFKVVVDSAYAPTALVLPSMLSDLSVDVVQLNANVDESKLSVLRHEFDAGLERLSKIVGALGTDLGVRLDVGGEKIFLVDDRGRRLPDTIACAALADLALRTRGGGVLVVPVDQSLAFEQIAGRYGGRVVRTKVDPHSLMKACSQEGVVMAGDGTGNFIFPAFQPVMDGLMAIAKLLEFLAIQETRLSEVVAGLPPFFLTSGQVGCPWEAKGKVMRLLSERFKESAETLDGIKIWLGGGTWVLLRPDLDRPLCHVVAEAASTEEAQSIVDHYRDLLRELQAEDVALDAAERVP